MVLLNTLRGIGEMTGIFRKTAFVAMVAAMAAQPAQACWTGAAEDAAKIKHLNTMLMVTALRCRNTADNFLPQYNRFVTKHNALIGSQNNLLKTHLAKTYGARGAEGALDRLSIGYANSYGMGHKKMNCGELKQLAASLSSTNHGVATMAAEADKSVDHRLAGARCAARVAGGQ